MRRAGKVASALAYMAFLSAADIRSHNGVSIMPGETVFTRVGAKSSARPRVNPSIAALMAETSARARSRLRAKRSRDQCERSAGRDLGGARHPEIGPELAVHHGKCVRHGNLGYLPTPAGAGGGDDVVPGLSVGEEGFNGSVVHGVERLADSAVSQRLHRKLELASERPAIMTCAPASTAALAVASPMPELPPTTNMC